MKKIFHTNFNLRKAGVAILSYKVDLDQRKLPETEWDIIVCNKED